MIIPMIACPNALHDFPSARNKQKSKYFACSRYGAFDEMKTCTHRICIALARPTQQREREREARRVMSRCRSNRFHTSVVLFD